jgi:hypothetical protein
MEDICNETMICLRDGAGLGMHFLEDLEHLGGKVADIVLHIQPELNGVKLDLKMTDFNNGLGYEYLDDLAEKDQPAKNNRYRFLVSESNVVLVGWKNLEGILSDVVADGEEDKLVKDSKLNLVKTHKAEVVGGIWVDGDHKPGVGWRHGDIEPLSVVSVKPLHIALACKEKDTHPLLKDVGLSRDVHGHNRLAIEMSG